MKIRIGTRTSALALKQTEIVIDEIKKRFPSAECEIVGISTKGDKILDKPVLEFGGKGVFVEEIENALKSGEIDIAVHSGKDLPAEIGEGLGIIATPQRGEPGDALIALKGTKNISKIGTGSLRRISLGRRMFPNAEFIPIRGNIQTRLKKLETGEVDAVILACAGISRMGIDGGKYSIEKLDVSRFVPAAAQGIIAVEGRTEGVVYETVSAISHYETNVCFNTEREILRLLGADCHAAAGVHAVTEGENITVNAFYGESGVITVSGKAENIRGLAEKTVLRIKNALGGKSVEKTGVTKKVYITGAGCGDSSLITARALELIGECDALIYDSLLDENLLNMTKEGCRIIFAGKRAGSRHMKQEEINSLIISEAEKGGSVVRLKGGDPFIFGRGGEEAEALLKAGIPFEVVPGVSSSSAAALFAGIPVTHRGISRSFTVVTGHTLDNSDGEDFKTLAELNGTLIFLMGLKNLSRISEKLIENGKNPRTPAAVISGAYTPHASVIRGELCSIAEKADKAALKPPAVIVVGEVCRFDFSQRRYPPLSGVTVAVTGTPSFASKLSEKLKKSGAYVFNACRIEIEAFKNNAPFDNALNNICSYSCIAFTSPNGVNVFFNRFFELGFDIRALGGVKFAAIGSGTAERLREYGINADLIPAEYTSESLGVLLAEKFGENEKILIPRAEGGSRSLIKPLKNYDEIIVYSLKAVKTDFNRKTDFVVFASQSGVKSYFENGGVIEKGVKAVAIGPVTAKALENMGVHGFLTADRYTADGVAEKIISEVRK
ncbi:uroporphyrinogen-III C-methyltransferase [Anaerotignum faecicola]|nr:uroporphyrinogen-III C-methyltransferase [Anaerotignum faecicola]